MSFEAFGAKRGLVIVSARVYGPTGDVLARPAVDTGAVTTVVRPGILASVGYDVSAAPEQVRLISASGIVVVPRLLIDRVAALNQERGYLPILSHAIPPAAGIDGVLGLDFFRGRRLTVNFRRGRVGRA